MVARLSAAIRDRLDVLIAVDDQPYSPLHRIETNLSNQALCDTLDQAVDMCRKLLDRNRKVVDDMLETQRHAVDRVVHRYHRLGTMLDPDARRSRVASQAVGGRAGAVVARGPVRLGELYAGRSQGAFRADHRAARRAEPVCRAVPGPG